MRVQCASLTGTTANSPCPSRLPRNRALRSAFSYSIFLSDARIAPLTCSRFHGHVECRSSDSLMDRGVQIEPSSEE